MRKLFTLIFFSVLSFSCFAQDIIIKTDKTEIKSKVLEIDDTNIKYKQFEHLDGPTYSIKKVDVFMILYKNGKRETFDSPAVVSSKPAVVTEPVSNITPSETTESSSLAVKILGESARPTADDVDFALNRVTLSFQSNSFAGFDSYAFGVEATRDYTLLPNYINWGPALFLNAHFVDSEYGSSSTLGYGGGLYLLGYLPLNRHLGNVENQNLGLFPWVRSGFNFGFASTSYEGSSSPESSTFYGFSWQVGADYRFKGKFGLTVYTSEFEYIGGGINFKL